MKTVIIQNWEESERGFGTRPDGFTIHKNKKQCIEYTTWYYKTYNNLEETPDEYTRISGAPIEVEVSDELYDRIAKATTLVYDNREVLCVHGKEKTFRSSGSYIPMNPLKEEDIQFPEGY